MKLAEDLYFYPWESLSQNNANSVLIAGPVKTLIDPGHEALFPTLARKMEKDGHPVQELALVVNTHCHPDHFEASRLLAAQGVQIALHPDDEAYMREIGAALFQGMGQERPAWTVHLHLIEGDLNLGPERLEVFHTPGHSPGEVCLYWPKHKALIAGDLIFAQGVGRTDFPGGSGPDLKESIERMAGLDIEVLLPGHGPAVIGRERILRNFELIRRLYYPML